MPSAAWEVIRRLRLGEWVMAHSPAPALVLRDGDEEVLASYGADGLDGLDDEPRPGRPRTIDHAKIVAATLKPAPKKLGVTHWSSRLLAARLGIDNTVAKAWRDYGSIPGDRRRSSSPPIPSWSRRSPTLSVFTLLHQKMPSFCAWMRSRRSRPWTAPSRRCR